MDNQVTAAKTYLWCDTCRRSFRYEDAPERACPVCGSQMRDVGKMSAVFRGLFATELVSSDLRSKHRQLVRLIWTRHGMGESYYRVLAPDMTYNKFETRVTDLICRMAEEGLATIHLPVAPSVEEDDYRIEFASEDAFIEGLETIAEASRKKKRG